MLMNCYAPAASVLSLFPLMRHHTSQREGFCSSRWVDTFRQPGISVVVALSLHALALSESTVELYPFYRGN